MQKKNNKEEYGNIKSKIERKERKGEKTKF